MEITKKNVNLDFWMGYLQAMFDFQVNDWVKQYGTDYKADIEDWRGFYDDDEDPLNAVKEDLSNA